MYVHMVILCAYQCYAPLPPVRAIVGQGGDLINLHINCPNIRDIPNNQIPLQKVGDYWGFDTHSVTVQYTETVAVLKVSLEVIKCPTIGAASFGQSPYVARLLPVRGVVGHNIDRCITWMCIFTIAVCRWEILTQLLFHVELQCGQLALATHAIVFPSHVMASSQPKILAASYQLKSC